LLAETLLNMRMTSKQVQYMCMLVLCLIVVFVALSRGFWKAVGAYVRWDPVFAAETTVSQVQLQ
jgi:hypothetical protein